MVGDKDNDADDCDVVMLILILKIMRIEMMMMMMIMRGGWRVSQWLVLLIRDRVMACGDTATLTLPLPRP